MLVELADHAGEVVTRERLVELLWPRGIVDFDNSLNGIVRKLRVVLGDDSDTPRYIETLPRIGYRFVGRLDLPLAKPALPAGRPPRWPWALGGSVVLALILGITWQLRPHPAASPESPVALAPPRTTSARAYEHYLDAIHQRSRRDVNGAPLAIAAFEAALREDERYAEAWAGLSSTLLGAAVSQDLPLAGALQRAKQAALRAVELDESLSEAHASLGQVYTHFDRNYRAAEKELERALQLNGNSSRAWHGVGILRAFQGRAEEALAAMRRARELEPMTLHFNSQYGLLLYHARRFDEAIAHLAPLLEAQPKFDQARSVMIRALVAMGRHEEALAQARLRGTDIPNMSDLALVCAGLGRRQEALDEARRIESRSGEGYGVMYEVAVIQAALGEVDAGCRALARATDEHGMFVGWLRLDPRLDPLRGAPCFKSIEARVESINGE